MQGWIKLHRKLIDWEWFQDSKMVLLFIYLLLSANHEDGRWRGIDIKRGQLITGLDSLKSKTGISTQTLRTCLSRLEKSGELTSKSTNKYRVLTLCNYEAYQIKESEANKQTNKQLTSNQQSTNKQLTANKNDNNNKNEKNEENVSPSTGILDVIGDYSKPDKFTLEQFTDKAFQSGVSDEDATDAYHHYRSQGFMKSNRMPIMNIESALVSWRNKKHQFSRQSEGKTFAEKEAEAQDRIRKERTERIMRNV